MPRIGAEPERRAALITSAIHMIGDKGSLDVSVKEIARHAGMSSALAFHYFGDKDGIIIETMRHLLREFSNSAKQALSKADKPNERLSAIIQSSFTGDQFERNTVAAWLVLYLRAFSSPQAARLLEVYTARLRSNLTHALRPLVPASEATLIAEGLGAMIDGIYIRHALRKSGPDPREAINLCEAYLAASLKNTQPKTRKAVH